ncbi:unnamed protein product [Polarella glacialis]|uniref:Uncharacterized protein n=1 Tax=Polarella glacialis TaxID=89957 RepID=A0A813KBK7_POLGL|nr:unnamed protein product [Polarella glacialis]CAE8695927.1 unnamed protein product [Polarella glacialis]|mmetsp:Transcript_71776/g.115891  ORF Transcript_71776/g.115891 Transcript_71776/m.115891 type:complete len:421 (-) Transcript_71776:81-1343(-)
MERSPERQPPRWTRRVRGTRLGVGSLVVTVAGVRYLQKATAFLPAPAQAHLARPAPATAAPSAVEGRSAVGSLLKSSSLAVAAAAAAGASTLGAATRSRPRQRKQATLVAASFETGQAPLSEEDQAVISMEGTSFPEALAKLSSAEVRDKLEMEAAAEGQYENLTAEQRGAVSNFFFPDAQELDMDKSMPLEDHVKELRDGALRAGAVALICVSACLTFYKELTTALESPAQVSNMGVKFVQLAPGEFFFVSVKVAIAVGLLLAFPYALFEAAVYFTPALTRSERNVVGPTVLASAALFYGGAGFAYFVLSPAALGFFLGYSQDVIESQFSIDQYFEFILSMGFATGIAFQVPVLQVALGLLNVIKSEQLFSVWRYVLVGSAVVGAVLTPSTDPVTQLLLSGALCVLYFTGASTLLVLGK